MGRKTDSWTDVYYIRRITNLRPHVGCSKYHAGIQCIVVKKLATYGTGGLLLLTANSKVM